MIKKTIKFQLIIVGMMNWSVILEHIVLIRRGFVTKLEIVLMAVMKLDVVNSNILNRLLISFIYILLNS